LGRLDSVVSRLLPSACYYGSLPELPPDVAYLWNELDTHDRLTDWFKHFRTCEEVKSALERLGLRDIHCAYGGNGVEARARRAL
jgi:hypothetical protein